MRGFFFFHTANPFQYEPETLGLETIGITNDATVYYTGTPQERTGAQIWTYVNTRFVNMKTRLGLTLGVFNLDDYLYYLYLFIGGTASAHKWNWLDMRDLDAAYRLIMFGGITHNELGMKGNGSNAYCNTFFVASTVYGSNHGSFGHKRKVYTSGIPQGGQTNATGQDYEWGANNGASLGNAFTTIVGAGNASIAMVRVNGTQFNYVKDGVNTVVAQTFVANPTQADSLLCFSTNSPTLFTDGRLQYAWRGKPGLTVAQAIIINDELDGLQSDLGR